MKHLFVAVLMLFSASVFSQSIESQGTGRTDFIAGWNFLTKTNYVKNVTDSTGFLNVGRDLMTAREVSVTVITTDSAAIHLSFVGRNPAMSSGLGPRTTVGAVDSLTTTSETGGRLTIVLKGPGVDRLPSAQDIKMITKFPNNADAQGNTAGRTAKFYLRAVW